MQQELPLLSKLFGANLKGFVIVNEGTPSIITKQKKEDISEFCPKTYEVKRATNYSNLKSDSDKTNVHKDVKCQSLDESPLFVKDNSTHATEFSNVGCNDATKNSNPVKIQDIESSPINISLKDHNEHKNFKISDRTTLLSEVGRVGFEPTTPAMSRRYLNQARPPALVISLSSFFIFSIYNL